MEKKVLCIYGSQGVGRECLEMAREINERKNLWNKILLVDDFRHGEIINECEVINFKYIEQKYQNDECCFVIATGEPKVREMLHNKVLEKGFDFARIIYNGFRTGYGTVIDDDTTIAYGSIITCNARISAGSYINIGCVIGHDVQIGRFCVISPGVSIGGFSAVDDCSFVGIGVVIADRIRIGKNCIIGAGAVVVKDVPDNTVVVGNPAKFLRENTTGKIFKN